MKVAMIARATLHSSPGGDTTQMLQTAEALRTLGVQVDVRLTNEPIIYDDYDLLHFFNIIRPADILRHTSKSRVPYVVSTIFVEYGHEDEGSGFRGRLQKMFGTDGVEYIKAIARRVRNGERVGSFAYMINGHRRSVQRIAQDAAMLLPNSESEYRRFEARYGVSNAYHVVPNGVDIERILASYPPVQRYKDAVICMGRIEPRKNQLRLIRALRGSGYRLFIHGTASPNHAVYYELCRKAAGDDCVIAGWLNGGDLYAAYASAKVHALPSFFETTGLSSLEAAAMGCNIVIGPGGDTRDYFGDAGWYCNPRDEASILAAVSAAHEAPYQAHLGEKIRSQYTWARAGEETSKAYRQVLNKTPPGT